MAQRSTLTHHPERSLTTTIHALSRGYPLSRAMTDAERLVVAIVASRPTHTLTIHSPFTRDEMADAWHKLVRRINRSKRQTHPLIYVASLAKSNRGGGGYHLHALLWDYLDAAPVIGHTKDLGLGRPRMRQLPPDPVGEVHYWRPVAYALAQHEAVFGTRHHDRHDPLVRHGHRLLKPQNRTLKAHCPQLLSAFQQAESHDVQDKDLLADVPMFSKGLIANNQYAKSVPDRRSDDPPEGAS